MGFNGNAVIRARHPRASQRVIDRSNREMATSRCRCRHVTASTRDALVQSIDQSCPSSHANYSTVHLSPPPSLPDTKAQSSLPLHKVEIIVQSLVVSRRVGPGSTSVTEKNGGTHEHELGLRNLTLPRGKS